MSEPRAPRPSRSTSGSKKAPPDAEAGFEDRLERLRSIVEELEGGSLALETAIERYEEGVAVLRSCSETLARARVKVEQLSRDAEGALEIEPLRDLEREAAGRADDDDDESEDGG